MGSRAGAMALRGPQTQVLDLTGYTVLPGLIDAHLHLTGVGLDLAEVDLFKLHSYADVVAKTAAFARTSPDAWILGDGWDQTYGPERRFRPTNRSAPDPSARRAFAPRWTRGSRQCESHAACRRSKSTTDPAGGRIVRDAQGDPTGVFVDNAQDLIYRKVPIRRMSSSFGPRVPRSPNATAGG